MQEVRAHHGAHQPAAVCHPRHDGGHYESHTEVRYFKRALWPVEEREDIPAGTYACRALEYRCPRCGRRRVKLSVFLPVRDKNKMEETILFDDGEQMEFLWH